MEKTWKWILGIGAVLSAVTLVGLLIYSRFGMVQAFATFGHGTRGGDPHATYVMWSPFGGIIFGAFLLLVIFGILFWAVQAKAKSTSAIEIPAKPLEVCPGCGTDLEPNWQYCPLCAYDLS